MYGITQQVQNADSISIRLRSEMYRIYILSGGRGCRLCTVSAVVGAGRPTRHLPPLCVTHHRNSPSPRTDIRDSCFWGGAGVRRANVWLRDVNWRAWFIDDSNGFHIPHVASFHAKTRPAAASRWTLQQTTCQHLLQPCTLRLASISHMLPSLTSSFSSCYVICRRRSLDTERLPCDNAHGDRSSGTAASK